MTIPGAIIFYSMGDQSRSLMPRLLHATSFSADTDPQSTVTITRLLLLDISMAEFIKPIAPNKSGRYISHIVCET